MVKLGFVVEGDIEKLILESDAFRKIITNLHIDFVPSVVNAKGNGNLLPKNINDYKRTLEAKGANVIIVLTDQDKDQCITHIKERIGGDLVKIVSVKRIEAWFLADSKTLSKFLQTPNQYVETPEEFDDPFQQIRITRMKLIGKGVSDKVRLAKAMIGLGFSVNTAAQHPNCRSARYLIKKLNELASKN